jgi:hypothetical protein
VASVRGRVAAVSRLGAGVGGRLRDPEIAHDRGGENDEREGRREQEQRGERRRRDQPVDRPLQRALRHPQQRFDHDHEHGGLDPDERRLDEGHIAIDRVDRRQGEHDGRAGQDEEKPGREASPDAMQLPARVGRKLHRLGSGQQHAEIERMQEGRLVEPFLFVDQNAVHQGDMPCRSAERQQADPAERARRFAEGRSGVGVASGRGGVGDGHGKPRMVCAGVRRRAFR